MDWRILLCLTLMISMSFSEYITDEDEDAPVSEEKENNSENDENEENEDTDETLVPTTEISTIPTTTLDYCHCDMEIFGLDDLEGVLKSPNYPGAHCGVGKCIYKILPHPNMTLRVDIDTLDISSGSSLKFWNILMVDDKEYNVYHSECGSYITTSFGGYTHFTTAVNVGMKIVFSMQRNTNSYSGFKVSFERVSNETTKRVCPDAHVVVGVETTIVTVPKQFSFLSGCTFYLTPSVAGSKGHQDEMLIEIENMDFSYVSIRSYDEDGLFVGDAYMNDNRSKLVDASRVEVMFRRGAYGLAGYQIPKITAKLMNQTCQCPPSEVYITHENGTVNLRSPGFPNLYCPSRHCDTIIRFEKQEKRKDDVDVILVMSNCSLGENDLVTLTSVDTNRVIFKTRRSRNKPQRSLRPLMIGRQDMTLSWVASNKKQKRYLDMNFHLLEFAKECVCSLFNDKEYKNTGFLMVTIPGGCQLMHCHWKFSADDGYPPKHISIEFSIGSPFGGDTVYVITDQIEEEYYGVHLLEKHRLTSATSPVEFTFSRFHLDDPEKIWDSQLNITWTSVEACECPSEEIHVKVGEESILTSPNYPELYCPNLVCRHTVIAPDGYRLRASIDNVDIEQYHDYLKVYDGNGTLSQMLARLTGKADSVILASSQEMLYLVFITDETNSNTGFHANFQAIPYRKATTKSGYIHWMVVAILVVLIVALGGVYAVYRKKRVAPKRRVQTLENPNAQIDPFADGFDIGFPLQEAAREPVVNQ